MKIMKISVNFIITLIAALFICIVAGENIQAQMGGPGMASSGYGYCPMCGQQWDGHYRDEIAVPESLPKPVNRAWVRKLTDVLNLEKLSKAQYQSDSDKYRVHMPYMMVIHQEDNHIAWITKLFAAYGISAQTKVLPVEKSGSLEKAYTIAIKLENDLIPRYEWLIKNAENPKAAKILDTILLQTRMHSVMFQHAQQMRGSMGNGMMHR